MIINFSVKNFGCIKDKVTLSFEATKSNDLEEYYIVEPKKGLRLLKLGLIYGPNASGKTTILKALDFLREIVLDSLDKKNDEFNFEPFLFDQITPNESTHFSLDFIKEGIRYLYKIELNKYYISNESLFFYNPSKALVFKRKTHINKKKSKIEFGSKIKLSKIQKAILEGNTIWNNTVFGGYLKTNIEFDELLKPLLWFDDHLKPLIESHTQLLGYVSNLLENKEISTDNVIKYLNKADFNVTDIFSNKEDINLEDFPDNPDIYREHLANLSVMDKIEIRSLYLQHRITKDNSKYKYILPFNSESRGTKRYYELSGILDLLISYSIIFPIDELESSLHSDLLEHFLLTFLVNAKQSQLIATTHQRELLMKKDILRHDAIWFTEKKTDGSTDLYSLADFDSSVVRDTTSIYNAYKIGKLGAKPNLGDYYIETTNGEKK